MSLQNLMIKVRALENAYLILLVYTLLFFSDDGILAYGSIPTYLILLGLIITILRKPNSLILDKFEQPFLVFLICLVLSIILGASTVKLLHIQSFLLMFLTYLYARSISAPNIRFQYLIWVFASFLLLNLSLMAAQLATGNPVLFPGESSYLVPTGFAVDQHKNALHIVISYAFIQSYLVRNKYRLYSLAFFMVCLTFLLINTSRAGLVVFVVTTAYIYLIGLKLKHSLLIMGLTTMGIFLLYLIASIEGAHTVLYDLLPLELGIAYKSAVLKYTAFFSDDSVYERYMLWSSLTNMNGLDSVRILTFGLGPGSFDSMHSQTIHNTPLDILVSVGMISLISLSIVIIRIIRFSVSRNITNDSFALSAVVVSIVLFSMFHDFGRARYLWVFLGLAASCYYWKNHSFSLNLFRLARYENTPRGHRA